MTALVYLLRTRIKNRLLSMLKNPGSLIGIIIMVALVVFVFVAGNGGGELPEELLRDINELYAALLLLLGAMFVVVAKNGLNKGTSLFSMSDVNLLFTAPVSNRRILLYGLVQQLGTSLLAGLFLLYQYSWMHNVYGVGAAFMVAIVLAYAIMVFCAQLTAMTIYVYTSGSDRRKRLVMWGMVAVCALAVGWVAVKAYMGQDNLLASIVAAANGLPLALFPVAGWLQTFVVGVSTGNWLLAIGMLALCALFIALLTRLVTSTQADYYEDVLQATETSFSAITAAKEGKARESLPENIKVGKTGLGHGWGASAFFYKLGLETRRARRFILDTMSLIMLVMTLGFAFFMRNTIGVIGILAFATYVQFFTVSTGRWVRELLLPYVYLVPESAFKKLLWCLLDNFKSQAVEAAIMALGLTLIMGLTPLEGIAFFIARLSFGVLLTSGLILVERLFTGLTVRWLLLVIMILVDVIIMLPGIALAIWVSIAFPDFLTANLRTLLLPAVVNFIVALGVIFASRNVLRTAELNNQ